MATQKKGYSQHTLHNGLVVALYNIPSNGISGKLRVFAGGLHEKQGEEGLSHLLEHVILFGGGKKYTPVKISEARIYFDVFNASITSLETCFYAEMWPKYFDEYTDLLSDSVFSPSIQLSVVEREKMRVYLEILGRKSKPDFPDDMAYKTALFGDRSILTYPTWGDEEVIGKATPDNLRKIHQRVYHPDNMQLVFVGNLPKNAYELIAERFGDKPRGKIQRQNFPERTELDDRVILHTYAPDLVHPLNSNESNAYLRIGFFAKPESAKSEEAHALYLLSKVLGLSLFEKMSSELGCSYGDDIKCDYDRYTGTLYIAGNVHAPRADEAIDAIFKEIDGLKTNLISQSVLDAIIRKEWYGYTKSNKEIEFHVDEIGNALHGVPYKQQQITELEEITPEMVREVARKYLPTNRTDGKYVLLLRDPLKQ